MPICTIRLQDQILSYTLKRSSRRRTIGLQVSPEGVSVTIPDYASKRDAERALENRSDWIFNSLKKWEGHSPPRQLEGHHGERLGYLGRELELIVLEHDRARTRIDCVQDALRISIDARLDDGLRPATVKRAVDRWRRQTALDLMRPKIEQYAFMLDLKPPPVSIRVNRSRWGSCSSDGSIRMNARLIAFEEDLIEYVCAHEACHLIEMNHSRRFYALLDQIMPDHRARSKRLKSISPPGMAY